MAAPQQGGGQNDNSAGIIWGVAATFAAVGGIWFVFKNQIVYFFLLIKLYEVNLLTLFSESHFSPLRDTILAALRNPAALSFPQLVAIGQGVGDFLRFPFVVLLFLLAFVVYLGNTARVYRRNYNMKDLAKFEVTNWPQINPVINLDLIKTDIDKGPWAMALTPMQFCKRFRLLEEVRAMRREGMTRKDRDKIDIVLKKGDANKIFALQLGPLWKGVNSLPNHTKALFAVFAARINADSKTAANILSQLAASAHSKLDMSGVDDLIKKHLNTKLVQEVLATHAYVLTVMAAMLEKSREDGVQASADFLWLKPVDRRLWYTLNTVGRQTPFVEVGGIFAHWVAEKEAGRKLLVPMVEEATKAVEIALKEVVYKPDET